MSEINENLDQPNADHSPAKEAQNPLVKFLNSALGLTLVGFALTGLIGGFFTWWLNEIDRGRELERNDKETIKQQQVTLIHQETERIRVLRNLVDNAILRRLAYTEVLQQQLSSKEPSKLVDDAWTNYWTAYFDYFLARGNNVRALRQDLGFGSYKKSTTTSAFWLYLNYRIDPEFDKIHACLLKEHDAQFGRNEQPTSFNFNRCVDAGNPNDFWFKSTRDWPHWDPWAKFKECVHQYVLETDYDLRFREDAAAVDEVNYPLRESDIENCPQTYGTNAWCNLHIHAHNLISHLEPICGPLPSNLKD